ncbi:MULTISPECIES: glycosyltransferase family 2 protein [unclassified Serratia (in: enterobacteria)]|uniref:glycosyltransferase family 2 protein n=1 Tax=unclassified Serratia (in: enterobacteria) TaxID=2647522 RepID=UPI000469AF7F|nr:MULTISPECIES: glycosyltransferase family 2 protein [unclassified Serratia (in: enterobacteria)]
MVYIVVLNWNGKNDTIACINSLVRLEGIKYTIVVCDNGSQDDSLTEIKTCLDGHCETLGQVILLNKDNVNSDYYEPFEKKVFLVDNINNLGFAAGNNVGIRLALNQEDCDYVWVLNNDTEVDVDSLKALVEKMKLNPRLGLCGSKLVYFSDKTSLQGLGGKYNQWLGTVKHVCAYKKINDEFDEKAIENQIDYIIGASLFFTKDCLNKVGLLSEDYFLYFEELDYSFRMKTIADFGIASKSTVFHKEGGSTGSGKSLTADFYAIKNRLGIAKKYSSSCSVITVWLSLWLVLLKRLSKLEFKKSINIISVIIGLNKKIF